MKILVSLEETEYNQLAPEQLGVNVTVGNGNDWIPVSPTINYKFWKDILEAVRVG